MLLSSMTSFAAWPGVFAAWRAARLWIGLLVASVVVGLAIPMPANAAVGVPVAGDFREQLYRVSVEVASRSIIDRNLAAAGGLNIILTRLSGLTVLPESPALSAAQSKPDRFYKQFRYVTTDRYDDLGQPVTELSLTYSPLAIRQLMAEAELPTWALNRPRVAIWLVERSGEGADFLDDPSHPLLAAVLGRASYRGMPAVVPNIASIRPSLDLNLDLEQDELMLVSGELDAEILLVGQAEQLGPDQWQVRWITWFEGEERDLNLAGSLVSVSTPALDMVANAQAVRFTVAGGAGSTLELIVENISDVAAYGQVLKYLASLGYIEKLNVSGYRASALTVSVNTTSSADNFSRLLQIDGRLMPSAPPSALRPLPVSPAEPMGSNQVGAVVDERDTTAVRPNSMVPEGPLRVVWQG